MKMPWNTHTCKTCSTWDQRYPENKQLGDCNRLPALLNNGILALLPASDWSERPDPLREGVDLLRTNSEFGCTSYTPKSK